ncbi:MAG: dihydrofolate reductase family protein [Paludibacter sp.]|nr:dihydrofolate reductase family protein [Paludibacter sp.]
MNLNNHVVLYIAMSLDGFIADKNGEIDFLHKVEVENEDYGYSRFLQSVGSVIMGRKTYDKVMSFGIEFPHKDKDCFIVTRQRIEGKKHLTFYNGNLKSLIENIKSEILGNIFIDGGAEIVNILLQGKLIDEMIISVIPILLGGGVRLFGDDFPLQQLQLVDSYKFDSGLVQMHYTFVD